MQDSAQHAFLKTFQNPIKPIAIPDTSILQDSNTDLTQNPIQKESIETIDSTKTQNPTKTHIESNATSTAQSNHVIKKSLKDSHDYFVLCLWH